MLALATLTACVAPAPVYQTRRYPYQPAQPGTVPSRALRRVRPRRQHRSAPQPDPGLRHQRRRCRGRRRDRRRGGQPDRPVAAAVRRPPRWAWSAVPCWATAIEANDNAPRVYESYRVSIQTDNGGYRAFDVPQPGRPAHRRPRAHRQRADLALLIAYAKRKKPGNARLFARAATSAVKHNEGEAAPQCSKCDGKRSSKVNETKSAVASAIGRKFLGYTLWVAPGGEVKREVAAKALATFKQRVRQLTGRSGGRSMAQVVAEAEALTAGMEGVLPAGANAHGLARARRRLRHRLRATQLKQWKRGTTMLPGTESAWGQPPGWRDAVAANSRRWWRNSDIAAQQRAARSPVLERLGVPRLS